MLSHVVSRLPFPAIGSGQLIFGCISIVEFVLYVLRFVTQGHPTWESIVNFLTIQPVLSRALLLQGLPKRFMIDKNMEKRSNAKEGTEIMGNASRCQKVKR